MGKLLRISDYLLLSAALAGDTFQELKSGLGLWPAAMKTVYGIVPRSMQRKNYYIGVSKMLSTGDISKKINDNGEAYLELTSKGSEKFKRRFPMLALRSKKWDGSFMVVVFDIPEVSRNDRYIVRKKIEALGFAMLQESVWISPYHFEEDLREFFIDKGLASNVLVLEARRVFAGGIDKLVARVWKTESLNNNYQQIIDDVRRIRNLPDAEKAEATKSVLNLYIDTLKSDPFLPEELVNTHKLRIEAGDALASLNK